MGATSRAMTTIAKTIGNSGPPNAELGWLPPWPPVSQWWPGVLESAVAGTALRAYDDKENLWFATGEQQWPDKVFGYGRASLRSGAEPEPARPSEGWPLCCRSSGQGASEAKIGDAFARGACSEGRVGAAAASGAPPPGEHAAPSGPSLLSRSAPTTPRAGPRGRRGWPEPPLAWTVPPRSPGAPSRPTRRRARESSTVTPNLAVMLSGFSTRDERPTKRLRACASAPEAPFPRAAGATIDAEEPAPCTPIRRTGSSVYGRLFGRLFGETGPPGSPLFKLDGTRMSGDNLAQSSPLDGGRSSPEEGVALDFGDRLGQGLGSSRLDGCFSGRVGCSRLLMF